MLLMNLSSFFSTVSVIIVSNQVLGNPLNQPPTLGANHVQSGSAQFAAQATSTCNSSGNCGKELEEIKSSRIRRDLDYIEPVLAAILDTFVDNEMRAARRNDAIDNEVYSRQQPEPMLVTLARYFDKYADSEVKKHVKAGLFFVVHILGKVYWFLQNFIRILVDYGLL